MPGREAKLLKHLPSIREKHVALCGLAVIGSPISSQVVIDLAVADSRAH